MLQDMVHPQDQQLSIEEINSPLGTHILEFCESELFPETVQNSEVGSSSNCSNENNHSSYQTHLSNINTNTIVENEIKPAAAAAGNMSIIFDDPTDQDNDISAAIDFSTSPSFPSHHQYNNINNHEAFDISSLTNQLPLGDHMATNNNGSYERWSTMQQAASYEDECLSSYIDGRLKPAACSSLIDTMMVPYLPAPTMNMNMNMNINMNMNMNGPFSAESSLMLGTDQDLEFQGDNSALFIPDNMQRLFNGSTDLQGLSSESQHLYHGGATTSTTSGLASEISSLEDPTFKVGKLSVEERKRKIHRYMKKRNERNFSKKIKYACRKTLADSRPRVRGRFAKNDELGELGRNMDDDVGLYSNSIPDHQRKVVVKEEDDQDSSDIMAHISGVNSFKCNYPIQSWI